MDTNELEQIWDLLIDKIETIPLILATRLGPWLTPLVPAYFVHRAMVAKLETPLIWAWIAALALEVVGVATMYSLLRAYQWNREKRKSDPTAPIVWNIAVSSIYYLTSFLLVLLIEFVPNAVKFAPAAFVILSGASAGTLALIADQKRREKDVKLSKESVKKNRKSQDENLSDGVSNNTVKYGDLTAINVNRDERKLRQQQEMLDIYLDNPQVGVSEIARRLRMSRQTVYNYLNELEQDGLVHRNGDGVKVL